MALEKRAGESGLTSDDVVQGPELYIITAFVSLALYNVVELTVLIFVTFKKRRGVYFWSMLVATWGVAFNATGYLLKFLRPEPGSGGSGSVISSSIISRGLEGLYTALCLTGWASMVTGQSVVLFSRLHLLVHDRLTIRLVLAMIVVDAVLCVPPTVALFSLVNNTDDPKAYGAAYAIVEKVQLIIFSAQEFVLSTVYIVASARFLRSRVPPGGWSLSFGRAPAPGSGLDGNGRMVMYWLIGINILVVLLDVSILVLEFSGYYDLQTCWKAFVYSVKLKLEFSILNKLIMVVKSRNPDLFNSAPGIKLREGGSHARSESGGRYAGGRPNEDEQSGLDTPSILPVQTGQKDSRSSVTVVNGPMAAATRTKEQNSSRPEIPSSSGGRRVPSFSVVRLSREA